MEVRPVVPAYFISDCEALIVFQIHTPGLFHLSHSCFTPHVLTGLLMTIINLAYVFANPALKCAPEQQKKDSENLNSRANLLMAGLWWGVFSIFVLCGLKSRPGPPLPNLKAYIVTPWKRLWYTFR
jgi:hypothetical protein